MNQIKKVSYFDNKRFSSLLNSHKLIKVIMELWEDLNYTLDVDQIFTLYLADGTIH